jgi:hypothetical protein
MMRTDGEGGADVTTKAKLRASEPSHSTSNPDGNGEGGGNLRLESLVQIMVFVSALIFLVVLVVTPVK